MNKKTCTVLLIGRPNVGKSTLLNKILNYEVAIVSKFAQTTRDQIKGIYNDDEYQLVFLDTPGMHKGQNLLSRRLNQKAIESLKSADLILFLTPANDEFGRGDNYILNLVKETKTPTIIVLTKIDLAKDKSLMNNKIETLKKMGIKDIFGVGFDYDQSYIDLLNEIKKYAIEQEVEFEDDIFTDSSMRFLAKEIIRESALSKLYDELPHSIAVEIDDFKEQENLFEIYATIYVKKESQKGILIGKNASMIKNISIDARQKMQRIFNSRIFLNIGVKVSEDWVNDENKIKKLGY
ncbi:GTPase Era [Metamycoplasma salivarium]|uniref:GTPase Era n=2 Tax=Metamycoplasma salivarium TaxID=2124 RepID=A0A448ZYU7_METSV|nr:GTPase Era [Metamycoplasma salivarium]GIZ06018.1 GTPase Era [Metamycoplasma salivarium]CAD7361198.1 GTP-binding Era-like protein [Metamycoplasma salivarium]VEU56394.1 GTP-binding Era-like protein [Metamycoplasma salivarium]